MPHDDGIEVGERAKLSQQASAESHINVRKVLEPPDCYEEPSDFSTPANRRKDQKLMWEQSAAHRHVCESQLAEKTTSLIHQLRERG